MRNRLGVAAGVCTLALLLHSSALANPTRPDLANTDTDNTEFVLSAGTAGGGIARLVVQRQDSLPGPINVPVNGLVQTGTALRAGGRLTIAFVTPAANQTVTWIGELTEPDKVNRLPDRSQAAIIQRNFATTTLQFRDGAAVQTFFGNVTTGCQAKIRYRDYSPTAQAITGVLPGAWTRAQGTLVCEEFAVRSGIPEAGTRTRVQQIVGTKSDGTGLRASLVASAGNLQ